MQHIMQHIMQPDRRAHHTNHHQKALEYYALNNYYILLHKNLFVFMQLSATIAINQQLSVHTTFDDSFGRK